MRSRVDVADGPAQGMTDEDKRGRTHPVRDLFQVLDIPLGSVVPVLRPVTLPTPTQVQGDRVVLTPEARNQCVPGSGRTAETVDKYHGRPFRVTRLEIVHA